MWVVFACDLRNQSCLEQLQPQCLGLMRSLWALVLEGSCSESLFYQGSFWKVDVYLCVFVQDALIDGVHSARRGLTVWCGGPRAPHHLHINGQLDCLWGRIHLGPLEGLQTWGVRHHPRRHRWGESTLFKCFIVLLYLLYIFLIVKNIKRKFVFFENVKILFYPSGGRLILKEH